jgi:hypothetical protein
MKIAMFSAAFLLLSGAAEAQTYPPDTVLTGTVHPMIAATDFGASCYIGHGPATFLRNNADPKALVTIPEIVDSKIWDLSGEARLTFTSPTAGHVLFMNTVGYPGNVRNPQFYGYQQSYSGNELTVNFYIAFPDCHLNFIGVFDD